MGILDIARGSETDADTTADGDIDPDNAAETEAAESDGTSRRWLLALGLITVPAVAYALSRRRAAREAEFTEIELEPSDAESESASTE